MEFLIGWLLMPIDASDAGLRALALDGSSMEARAKQYAAQVMHGHADDSPAIRSWTRHLLSFAEAEVAALLAENERLRARQVELYSRLAQARHHLGY